MSDDEYITGYPTKPIGGGNPYYCCASCGISEPQINGRLDGHAEWCEWRLSYGETPAAQSNISAEAIWTPDQVKSLSIYQANGRFHPFTCPNRGDHPEIDGDRGILIPTVRGWICQFCDYTQTWAHDFMLQAPSQIEERSDTDGAEEPESA